MLEPLQYGLGAGAGVLVGFTLGLVGGGGSILAVPLMVYLVGVRNPHVAIGTSAFAVAINAAAGLLQHARAGTVKWRCGGMYATAGILGAFAGSSLGKLVGGEKLLFLFALLMLVVGVLMLRGRGNPGEPGAECNRAKAPKVLGFGLGTGAFSGFFGIGGGFLIVPALVFATGMPMINAIGSSLLAVGTFGLATALNYARSGLVDWVIAGQFIAGGVVGGILGMLLATRLSAGKATLNRIFAALILTVATYVIFKNFPATIAFG